MIAIVGTLGSSSFRFHHGSRKQVTEWLAEQERLEEERNERTGNVNWYIPSGIVSDRVFRTWRWLDGSRVWNPEHFRLSGEQEQYDFRADRGRHPRALPAPDWYPYKPQNEPWTNPDK